MLNKIPSNALALYSLVCVPLEKSLRPVLSYKIIVFKKRTKLQKEANFPDFFQLALSWMH